MSDARHGMPAQSALEWVRFFQGTLVDGRGTGDPASADAHIRLQHALLQQLECRLRCMQASHPISLTIARMFIADVLDRLAAAMCAEGLTETSSVAILTIETIVTRILVLQRNS